MSHLYAPPRVDDSAWVDRPKLMGLLMDETSCPGRVALVGPPGSYQEYDFGFYNR